jgi:hypothetical protein
MGCIVFVLILSACGTDDPAKKVAQGDLLLSVTFDESGSWDEGHYPADAETPTSILEVTDGHYRIDHQAGRDASFIWGLGGDEYENIVIEIETEQLSGEKDNLYGIGCRLSEDEDGIVTGYALLISGDGHYGIATLNRTMHFILEWRQSDAIHQGRATNTIRAVCVDNYFAVYANGTFLGDVTDDTFEREGQTGLIAGVDGNAEIDITFDNLSVYEGSIE